MSHLINTLNFGSNQRINQQFFHKTITYKCPKNLINFFTCCIGINIKKQKTHKVKPYAFKHPCSKLFHL